jgi:hypothetical protein
MIINNKKSFLSPPYLILGAVITSVVVYAFLYFNLSLTPFPKENGFTLLVQYKNLIGLMFGLINFLGAKAALGEEKINPFTNIQLGIMIGLPTVLTTVSLISCSLGY